MGRIIAISSGDLNSTKPINEYAIKMLKGSSTTKRVLFIGTASNDAKEYIENITRAFAEFGCEVRALELTAKNYVLEEIKEMIVWGDIIYVGGGDTIFMMNVWRKHGLDNLLKEVYENDSAILMGISAGAICWFNCGCTDSELAELRDGLTYGWANDMLNINPYVFCPHYEDRTEDFEVLLQEKEMDGLAMESDTAFVEDNGNIYYIKCNMSAKAYVFRWGNGRHERGEVQLEGC